MDACHPLRSSRFSSSSRFNLRHLHVSRSLSVESGFSEKNPPAEPRRAHRHLDAGLSETIPPAARSPGAQVFEPVPGRLAGSHVRQQHVDTAAISAIQRSRGVIAHGGLMASQTEGPRQGRQGAASVVDYKKGAQSLRVSYLCERNCGPTVPRLFLAGRNRPRRSRLWRPRHSRQPAGLYRLAGRPLQGSQPGDSLHRPKGRVQPRPIPGAALPWNTRIRAWPGTPRGLTFELPPVADLVEVFGKLGVANDSRIVLYFSKIWCRPPRGFPHDASDAWGWARGTSILDGGFPVWQSEGRPVSREARLVIRGQAGSVPSE